MNRLTEAELEGLPPELIEQLSVGNRKPTISKMVMETIGRGGGRMSVDQILIAIWRETGKIKKGNTIRVYLAQMKRAGLVKMVGNMYEVVK